jgi:hypothetical protein
VPRYNRYDRGQIVTFLHALDHHLTGDTKIFVIGGTAAIVGYHADAKTADIDVFVVEEGSGKDLLQAAERATEDTGIDLRIGGASVADLPYNYVDRVRSIRDVRFKKLKVVIPDKYDLVLSKAVRGDARDFAAIEQIHMRHPLAEKTLVKRFETEIWKIANTDPRSFAFNMVAVIEVLYGKGRAAHYQTKWLT